MLKDCISHLNIFNYYIDKNLTHEDVLTRNFLVLVKEITEFRNELFKLINKTMTSDKTYKEIKKNDLKSIIIDTQVGYERIKEKSNMVVTSIIISNEFHSKNDKVKRDKYSHRYDGIIEVKDKLFIIENKPDAKNIWDDQLNINLPIKNNKLCKKACSLRWSDIIQLVNNTLRIKLHSVEIDLLNDFIEYIDNVYPELNAYDTVEKCKDNKRLLQKRAKRILCNLYSENRQKHHNSKDGNVESTTTDSDILKEIQLTFNPSDANKYVRLTLSLGDVMNGCRKLYELPNINKIYTIKGMNKYEIQTYFHFAFRSDNIFYSINSNLLVRDYINYWVNKRSNNSIKQIKRNGFLTYYKQLYKDKIVVKNSIKEFKSIIKGKNWTKLNVCPGIMINYYWSKKQAIKLDNIKDSEKGYVLNFTKFEKDVKSKVEYISKLLNFKLYN